MTWSILSDTKCTLGEGPLWHPERGSLFWFDILGQRLYEYDGVERHWSFDRPVSAAGWVSRDRLLVASSTDLSLFDLSTGAAERLVALEADQPETRSNDGRADPMGGFWIGTMGFGCEDGLGAIYRYYKGELRRLWDKVTVPNATCFAPDGSFALFADTPRGQVFRVALDKDGWPEGTPSVWLDLREEGLNPDGAVIDAEGHLWNAQWGAGRVARYDGDGRLVETHDLPTGQTTCPAFGGPNLSVLYVTSAAENTDAADRHAGMTFALETGAKGQPEPRVVL